MTHPEGPGRWSTPDGATLRAIRRPDGHWFVRLPEEHPDAWPTLVAAAIQDGCGTLILSRPADQDAAYARALRRAGFLPVRTETLWRLPVAAIPTIPARAEHQLVSVTEPAPEAVAVLDNAIRDDIPGTSRWLGTGAQLTESLDDSDFDPALYLIARHPRTGSLDGLVRVWNRHPEPRLGCIGVTTPWRRTSLALKLLQNIAATLRTRGVTHITAETDQSNSSSHLMALNHGGIDLGRSIEWQRSDILHR
jgi:hypothetical protein